MLLAFGGASLRAQPPSDAADSAAAARVRFNAARDALSRRDSTAAVEELLRAARWWPSQGDYHVSAARLGARVGNRAAVATSIDALTTLESGRAVLSDSVVMALGRVDARIGRGLEKLRVSLREVVAGAVHVEARDSLLFPEGLAIHPTTGSVYLTSIRYGRVLEVAANGDERLLPVTGSLGASAMAVQVDTDGAHLWVTTGRLPYHSMTSDSRPQNAVATLLRIRIADGYIVERVALDTLEDGVPGDLAVAPGGDVWVSDSRHPVLYRFRRDAKTVEKVTHRLFRSLQGMTFDETGTRLYVADYSHGLLRVNLSTLEVEVVRTANGVHTLGIDGLVRHNDRLIAVQNGNQPARIVAFSLDAGGHIANSRTLDRQDIADEPTLGTIAGNSFYYIANSQWEKYNAQGARIPGTLLSRPRVIRLPL